MLRHLCAMGLFVLRVDLSFDLAQEAASILALHSMECRRTRELYDDRINCPHYHVIERTTVNDRLQGSKKANEIAWAER